MLKRPKFAFNADAVQGLLDYLIQNGETVAAIPLAASLPDSDDDAFPEIALAEKADAFAKHPGRFKGIMPKPMALPAAAWINKPLPAISDQLRH